MVKNKNIVVCILLSIITCGIYGIIWFINMTDDAAYVNDDHELSGGKAFLFTLITCGIYGLYWNYKMGKELYEAKCKKGMNASDNSVLYLILAVMTLIRWLLKIPMMLGNILLYFLSKMLQHY